MMGLSAAFFSVFARNSSSSRGGVCNNFSVSMEKDKKKQSNLRKKKNGND
jgi:hypothetical protein